MNKILLTAVATPALAGALTSQNARLLHAQSRAADADHPTFETASVKLDKSKEPRVGIRIQPGGLYTATNVTLRLLIQNAYRVQSFQVSGGPDWVGSDPYDIVAKAGANPMPGQIPLMMQALLADRFKLTVHRETKEVPVYALVMAKTGGKAGPQLRQADCTPAPPPSTCGSIRVGPGVLSAQGITMAQLVTFLSGQASRVVIDRTGLTGNVDVDLTWAPDPSLGGGLPGLGPLPPGPAAAEAPRPPSDAPSLFTAIQEQLGLRMDSTRGPVDVLVIDRVEHPTED